jgi:hypothetical protein
MKFGQTSSKALATPFTPYAHRDAASILHLLQRFCAKTLGVLFQTLSVVWPNTPTQELDGVGQLFLSFRLSALSPACGQSPRVSLSLLAAITQV